MNIFNILICMRTLVANHLFVSFHFFVVQPYSFHHTVDLIFTNETHHLIYASLSFHFKLEYLICSLFCVHENQYVKNENTYNLFKSLHLSSVNIIKVHKLPIQKLESKYNEIAKKFSVEFTLHKCFQN